MGRRRIKDRGWVNKSKSIKGALGPKDKQRINIPDSALQDASVKLPSAEDKQKKTSKAPEAPAETVDTPAK